MCICYVLCANPNLPDKTLILLGSKIEGLLQHNHECVPRNEDSHLLLKDCLNASAPIIMKFRRLNLFLCNAYLIISPNEILQNAKS